jgi:hypothetical protein
MKPYMPSNGTEGCQFEGRMCDRCQKDVPPDPDAGRDVGECQIHNDALLGIQPKEWVEDEAGPRCTAFEPIKPAANADPLIRQPGDPDMPGQQTLFTEPT